MLSILRTVLATGAALAANPCVAQTPEARPAAGSDALRQDTNDGIDDPTTITVIGAPQILSTAAASVSILTNRDIDRSQDIAISDSLARLPGVTVTRNGGPGGFTGVRIRGADAAQTLVVIDGIRVQDPSSPSGGFDFGSLLSAGIERIEVMRGSNSLAWGSDAIGGVVAINTVGSTPQRGTLLSGEGGSYASSRISGRTSQRLGRVAIGLGAGLATTDGISSAANGTEADGFRQAAGNARVSISLGEKTVVNVSIIYAISRLQLDGFAAPTFAFGDTDEYQKSQEIYASTEIVHSLSTGFGDITQRLTLSGADINRDTFDTSGSVEPSFAARGRSERIAYQADWAGSISGRNDAIRLVLGADHEITRAFTGGAFSSDYRVTGITGGYVALVIKPTATLQVGGGVRHDNHRDFGGNTVFSANTVWQTPVDDLSVRASFAEGFKAPTLFQLSENPGAFGNPALDPERSRSYDLGLRYSVPSSDLSVEISLFRRDSRNLIDFVSCQGVSAPDICATGNRPFGTYANVDQARAEGIEFHAAIRPVNRLDLDITYALIATEDRSLTSATAGNELPRRPRNVGTVTSTYRFGLIDKPGSGTIAAEVRYVGASFDDSGNFVGLDDYALVALRAALVLTQQFELFGRVENLFDARYENVAGYGTYGRTGSIGIRVRF